MHTLTDDNTQHAEIKHKALTAFIFCFDLYIFACSVALHITNTGTITDTLLMT